MRPRVEFAARFWMRVTPMPDGECWEWTGSRHQFGHGRLNTSGRTTGAHRIAWEITHGPVPPGLCVLHRCDNPPCVRPTHLFLGTIGDNNRDMHDKGRHRHGLGVQKGELNYTAKLTEADVREIRRLQGSVPRRVLAKQYGVGPHHISDIWNHKAWKHLIEVEDAERPSRGCSS